ncbi:hypothetical protein [Planomicrobium okeanokoites]|nr:hypothetical protein [Planomicrobium okeanokoites]
MEGGEGKDVFLHRFAFTPQRFFVFRSQRNVAETRAQGIRND